MTFTRKEWVNVPDPSKLPPVPEGQDSLARFDAENMNRIENGIEEATHNVAKHTHSAEDVGLANVPNVTTNDQTPTYTEATTLTNLTSGEKISIAFGKIKKAITDFMSHNEDITKHITSTERTTWNNKANESHNHSKSQITDFPTSMPASDVSSWAKESTKPTYTASEVGAAPSSHTHDDRYYTESEVDTKVKSTYDLAQKSSFNLLKTQTISNVALTGSQSNVILFSGIDFDKYESFKVVLNGTIKVNAPNNDTTGQLYIYLNGANPYISCLRLSASNSKSNTTAKQTTMSIENVEMMIYRNRPNIDYSYYWKSDGTLQLTDNTNADKWYGYYVYNNDNSIIACAVSSNELGILFSTSSSSYTGTFTINGTIQIFGKERP